MFKSHCVVLVLVLILGACKDSTYIQIHNDLNQQWNASTSNPPLLNNWLESITNACGQDPNQTTRLKCLRDRMQWPMLVNSADPQDVWPTSVLINGDGFCVSLAFLALIALEKLEIEAHGVALPGHVYVQIPEMQLNWEPNRGGYAHEDSYYKARYQLDSLQGRISQKLSPLEFRGLFEYELANRIAKLDSPKISTEAEHALAKSLYEQSMIHWQDPRVVGNYALLMAYLGEMHLALHLLDSLWNLGLRSEELVRNRDALKSALSNQRTRVGHAPK